MATIGIVSWSDFKIGDIVTAQTSPYYGYKLVARPFIDAVNEYRWVVQDVNIEGNKATPAGGGKYLGVYSSIDLRKSFKYLWTPDKFVMKKGDLFKDQGGNFYIAESDTRLWSINRGTWAAVSSAQTDSWTELNGGKTAKLERVKTNIGDDLSKKLNLS